MSLARRLSAIVDFDISGRALGGYERGGMLIDYVETVARYLAAEGVDEVWLHLVTPDDRGAAALFEPLKALASDLFIPLVAWGAVSNASDARLVCGMGADRVVVAASDPNLPDVVQVVRAIAQSVGPDRVSAAVMVRRVAEGKSFAWEACDIGGQGTGRDAIAFLEELRSAGAGELVLIPSHEGELAAHPTGLVERLAATMEVQVVSMGFEREPADLAAPLLIGADAVATAVLFRDGKTTVEEVKKMLTAMGVPVRPAGPPYTRPR